MIFFISDTHFNHTNIIKYCNRPFDNIAQMNNTLIENWNRIILNEDVIYHLGDFALGTKEQTSRIVAQLNGIKYLIRGNHDNLNIKAYEEFGFNVLKNAPIRLDEYKLILSHVPIPDNQIPKDYINIHGHIHNKRISECIEYELDNYSTSKHLNISCDITEFKPLSIEEILSIIKKQ